MLRGEEDDNEQKLHVPLNLARHFFIAYLQIWIAPHLFRPAYNRRSRATRYTGFLSNAFRADFLGIKL
jgi:hypothetical protein